jgi:hypothetical protein
MPMMYMPDLVEGTLQLMTAEDKTLNQVGEFMQLF